MTITLTAEELKARTDAYEKQLRDYRLAVFTLFGEYAKFSPDVLTEIKRRLPPFPAFTLI